jgi:hypothetical protein
VEYKVLLTLWRTIITGSIIELEIPIIFKRVISLRVYTTEITQNNICINVFIESLVSMDSK